MKRYLLCPLFLVLISLPANAGRQSDTLFLSYLQRIECLPSDSAKVLVNNLFHKIAKDKGSVETIFCYFDKYVWNPLSIFRNEGLYKTVLDFIVSDDNPNNDLKQYANAQIGMLKRNATGTIISNCNFATHDSNGNIINTDLHSLADRYMLLLIGNPECNMCIETKSKIEESTIIAKLVSENRLRLVTMYYGTNDQLFKSIKHSDKWINGWDPSGKIINNSMFTPILLPALYLVDSDKIVILKEVPFSKIEAFFSTKDY